MIKVMIIDDEIVIRTGIRTSIDWESLGMMIVGEASNGREGLEKALSLKPQIILADVRMPIMDGLKFSEVVKKEIPNVKIVIITGYDDFAYAREALRLGVNEYLLKPIGADELISVMLKQRDEILKELDAINKEKYLKMIFNENLPFMQSRFVNALVKGEYPDVESIMEKAKELGIHLYEKTYQVAILDIDDFFLITENLSDKEKEQIKLSVKNIADEILSPETGSVVCFSEFDYLLSVINISSRSRTLIDGLYHEIQYRIRKHQRLTVTIGVSDVCTDILEIHKAYSEARLALRNKAFAGKDKIIKIQDIDKSQMLSPVIYPSADEKEIINCLKTMDGEKLNQILERIYSNFALTKADFDEIKRVCLRLISVCISYLDEIGVSFGKYNGKNFDPYTAIEKYETLEDIKAWMKDIFNSHIQAIQKIKNEKFKGIVQVAMQYANAHYQEDLSVEHIAAVIYVTPNYFSRVFKKETGKSFTEWLNAVRVEKAKGLLKDLGWKVYEVAEKVGYKDYKVFTHNFKKYAGFTPKEYRENNMT